jgi:hypothetical protein
VARFIQPELAMEDRLKKSSQPPVDADRQEKEDDGSDIVWGCDAVGAVIDRSASQVHHLLAIGALEGAARRIGHRTVIGSKRALRRLPLGPATANTPDDAA